MRIILGRHGQSEGNISEPFYAKKGDPHIELTREGWEQVIGSGRFLDGYLREHKIDPPKRIWVSPFMRTRQTLRGMIEGFSRAGYYIRAAHTDIREHFLLAEQTFGILPYMKYSKGIARRAFSKLFSDFSAAAYKHNPFMSVTPLGESPMDLFKRIDGFVGRLLEEEKEQGIDNVLIVAHGATIKAFMIRLFDMPMDAWKKLDTPGNGDLYMLDDESGSWRVTRIYDGEKGVPVNENPIKDLSSKVDLKDLPALPPRYR
ncbi:MAG: histidine phosphatase family protein [Pseudomonadota bacterium]|nr:histidine phosphatase family protein [Pseudomonadota bacterium]